MAYEAMVCAAEGNCLSLAGEPWGIPRPCLARAA